VNVSSTCSLLSWTTSSNPIQHKQKGSPFRLPSFASQQTIRTFTEQRQLPSTAELRRTSNGRTVMHAAVVAASLSRPARKARRTNVPSQFGLQFCRDSPELRTRIRRCGVPHDAGVSPKTATPCCEFRRNLRVLFDTMQGADEIFN
jgi:hypothetical protein